jgi:hypothetical protein
MRQRKEEDVARLEGLKRSEPEGRRVTSRTQVWVQVVQVLACVTA